MVVVEEVAIVTIVADVVMVAVVMEEVAIVTIVADVVMVAVVEIL